MFITECPFLDREVLVLDDQIDSHTSTHTAHGTAVEFDCPCGGSGVYLTGARDTSSCLIFHDRHPARASCVAA